MLCSIDCGLSCPGNTQVNLPFVCSILVLSFVPSQINCPDVWRLELLYDSYATGSVMIGTFWPSDSQSWWVPVAAAPSFLLLDAALLSIWEISRSRMTEHKMGEEAIERSSFVRGNDIVKLQDSQTPSCCNSHIFTGDLSQISAVRRWGVGGGDREGHMIL